MRDSGYSEAWYPEKEQLQHPAYWAEESLDALDSLETCTIRASSQGENAQCLLNAPLST